MRRFDMPKSEYERVLDECGFTDAEKAVLAPTAGNGNEGLNMCCISCCMFEKIMLFGCQK